MNLELAIKHVKEASIKEAPCELRHDFFDGVYMRSLFVPAGTIIIGKKHKKPMLNILAQGRMAVLFDDEMKVLEAPYMVMGKKERKAGYAIEDSVWSNVMYTDETDLDAIEAEYIEEDKLLWHG